MTRPHRKEGPPHFVLRALLFVDTVAYNRPSLYQWLAALPRKRPIRTPAKQPLLRSPAAQLSMTGP